MGSTNAAGRALGLVVAGGAAVVLAAGPAVAAGSTLDPSITEATGLAADSSRQVYWTAARTQGSATALRPDGTVAGSITYGATPQDVQAVGYRDGRLWVGDIGDAAGTRTSVVAYRMNQPAYGQRAPYRSVTLAYPDGAHDSRAMAVSPRGRLYLVTRGSAPGIYRTAGVPEPGGVRNTLTRVADAPANVTDAVFSADGTRLVLRTLTSLHVLDPYTFKTVASAPLPATDEGEAITTALDGKGLDGKALLVTGSGSPVPVDHVTQPTTLAPLSPAPATPTPSATPSASAAPSATRTDPVSRVTGGRGSVLSLVAAGVIALAAAVVVVVKR